MPTTRPGFIWSGTEWVAIGQEAVVNPFYYQATAPTGAATGAIWIESDVDVPSIDSSQFLRWRKTMTGGETSLSGNDDSSLPLAYTPGYEQLYINGVLQVRGGDYTATTGTTVTGLTALVANDVVEIFSAVARTVADVYTQTQSDARFVNKTVGGLNLVIPTSVTGGTIATNGAITFSGITGLIVNNCFTSVYENYKIIYNISSGNASGFSAMQLTSNGTPLSSSGSYNWNAPWWNSNNSNGHDNTTNTGSTTLGVATSYMAVGYLANALTARGSYEVTSPFLTSITGVINGSCRDDRGSNSATQTIFTGETAGTTSYDGFKFCNSNTGTFSGTIRIYGYNNGA